MTYQEFVDNPKLFNHHQPEMGQNEYVLLSKYGLYNFMIQVRCQWISIIYDSYETAKEWGRQQLIQIKDEYMSGNSESPLAEALKIKYQTENAKDKRQLKVTEDRLAQFIDLNKSLHEEMKVYEEISKQDPNHSMLHRAMIMSLRDVHSGEIHHAHQRV